MKSSLIPEAPLLLYPSLAATLGLEEAVMLSALNELAATKSTLLSNGFHWLDLPAMAIADAMPFWDNRDIQRIAVNLREKGVLLLGSAPFGETDCFKFAFNEKIEQQTLNRIKSSKNENRQFTPAQPRNIFSHALQQTPFSKQHIAPNWRPNEETLQQLGQHGIPNNFCLEQVPTFVAYWRDRKETQSSWEAKFMQHATHRWQKFQNQQHRKNQAQPMPSIWRPDADAMEILLEKSQIPRNFIEDSIAEFILYWRERGESSNTWSSKFISHVKNQWQRYSLSIKNESDPSLMTKTWQPSQDVYDVLRLANIPIPFAQKLVPEFILYWLESGQAQNSWSTKFLQHVKRSWAYQNQLQSDSDNKTFNDKRSTRDLSLNEELSDRNWAS